MSDAAWIALFAAMPPTIAAIGGILIGLRNSNSLAEAKAAAETAAERTTVVETKTDSMAVELKANTVLTDKVREQTNGGQERIARMLESLIATCGDHGTAIRSLQLDVANLKSKRP